MTDRRGSLVVPLLGGAARVAAGVLWSAEGVLKYRAVLLGLLLIAGLFTRLTAFASIGTLMLYWSSDQLIAQYPVMVLLSALVLASPVSGRFGIDGWRRQQRSRD